jgi:hypothetical protein
VSVRNPELGSPGLPGNRPISTQARVAALDLLLDELNPEWHPGNADMLIEYAAWRYERGEIEGARQTLCMAVDLTGAYRIEAVLHTEDA